MVSVETARAGTGSGWRGSLINTDATLSERGEENGRKEKMGGRKGEERR
jgi:hypothetical protein